MTFPDPHISKLEATVRRQDQEIDSHSQKLTAFEERLGSLEERGQMPRKRKPPLVTTV